MTESPQRSEYSEVFARLCDGKAPMDNPLFGLGVDLMSEFMTAEVQRRDIEERWLQDLRQYKGQYDPEVDAAITGSKAFLRKTRVKVESVDARMMDLLFPSNKERNFRVESTPEPSVPKEQREKIRQLLTEANGGKAPDAQTLKSAIKEFAGRAASRMETRIDDQLTEARFKKIARKVMHSGNLYGTGILKGPLVEKRTRVSYVWDGKKFVQQAHSFAAPFVSHVPIWRWYPDMTVTDLEDCRYVWEHHRLSRLEMANLAERKTFDRARILNYVNANPEGMIRLMWYEQELRDVGDRQRIFSSAQTGQFDVFERWGYLTGEQLHACGVEVPEDRMHEAFFANVWCLPDGEVIKAVLQPIDGMVWPYHLYYLDKDETSIFGEGFASIMRDDQEMINAAVRMLLDNAAKTAGPQYEVYVSAFPPEANLTDSYPGKVWPRTGGDMQYPAVRPLEFNSHMTEHMAVLQLFDANADEVTAIPKFTYGDNPKQGAAETLGGLSMLLGQANIALKDLVASWDEMTESFIRALYRWNMQFSRDDSIKGDFDVKAIGSASLIAKEMRAQAIAQMGATLQPEERAFVKFDRMAEERAKALDIADIIKTREEVEAEQNSPMAQMQQQMQQMLNQVQVMTAQAELAKIQAETQKAQNDALNRKIEAVFAAMQAAGVAAQSPAVAAGGDAILQSAGYQDATPADPVNGGQQGGGADPAGQMQQPGPQPIAPAGTGGPASPFEGQRAGIQTEAIEVQQ